MNDFIDEEGFALLLRKVQDYSIKNNVRPISPECGKLLEMLISIYSQGKRCINIIEIGTGVGYSTLWMVKGLVNSGCMGKVYTIDSNVERVKKAKSFFEEASRLRGFERLLDSMEVIHGNALDVIPKLRFNVDFAFIDGAKEEYAQYLMLLNGLLKDGSIVTAHNVISHKEKLMDFLQEIGKSKEWETLIIPMDSAGLSLSVRKKLTKASV